LEEDAIFVKSIEKELSKIEKELIHPINDRIAVGDKFDGGKTSAKILNGILYLTIPKKEELKPKKVTIKVG
jgi:HSP20 family molecular chaperone IbpA